jgi:hypothetical protein
MKLTGRTSGVFLGLAALLLAGLAGTHVTHLIDSGAVRHVAEVGLPAVLSIVLWRLSLRRESSVPIQGVEQ